MFFMILYPFGRQISIPPTQQSHFSGKTEGPSSEAAVKKGEAIVAEKQPTKTTAADRMKETHYDETNDVHFYPDGHYWLQGGISIA